MEKRNVINSPARPARPQEVWFSHVRCRDPRDALQEPQSRGGSEATAGRRSFCVLFSDVVSVSAYLVDYGTVESLMNTPASPVSTSDM
ncbi:hypothetical protein E2C01_003957 [Portunus trituberculatus]|uniref:Uncharacterized protein n=1 Tax=Portunus trituberculatus TaxID=210409 RepID=A0A5B7CQ23_PORTR|nr:hypothetical protein [Portunus trituberculatus]